MFDLFVSNHLSGVPVNNLESAINKKKICNMRISMHEDALNSHFNAEDAQVRVVYLMSGCCFLSESRAIQEISN